jgi:hypothetical protein
MRITTLVSAAAIALIASVGAVSADDSRTTGHDSSIMSSVSAIDMTESEMAGVRGASVILVGCEGFTCNVIVNPPAFAGPPKTFR